MDAYKYSVREMVLRMAESGMTPPVTLPTLREAAPLLLRTRTYEEFRDLYGQLFTHEKFSVYGPAYDRYGHPAITVVATRARLISVTIDPEWAVGTEATFIAQDIVECCSQIRGKKPEIVRDAFLDRESDRNLAARIVRHEKILMENDNYGS